MDSITLTGISANGTHGVLDFEKKKPQKFVVDAQMFLDLSAASRDDDLTQTVDYGQIAQRIVSVITGPHCDLIETLADRIARAILRSSLIRSVIVTVHKPQAPITVPFTDVTVRIERSQIPTAATHSSETSAIPAISTASQSSTGSDSSSNSHTFDSSHQRDAIDHSDPTVHRVFLSLGGNLGNVEEALRQAIVSLDGIAGNQIMGISPLYRTTPWGMAPETPDFLNCVVELETIMDAHQLLRTIHLIEATHGRTRRVHWGSRPLDIDIIDFDGQVSADPTLTLPHPRAWQRAFVLAPLADLAPDLELPGEHGGSVTDLLANCADKDSVEQIGADWILSAGRRPPQTPDDSADDAPTRKDGE